MRGKHAVITMFRKALPNGDREFSRARITLDDGVIVHEGPMAPTGRLLSIVDTRGWTRVFATIDGSVVHVGYCCRKAHKREAEWDAMSVTGGIMEHDWHRPLRTTIDVTERLVKAWHYLKDLEQRWAKEIEAEKAGKAGA